jgi:hypothetical protein
MVRVVRPYATETEWLREEGWTIARKSVYLVGIPTQPEGTLIRCELSLASGRQLLVAEGVVVKYVADHGDRPPGLVVRYRRLSSASSQFISRVLSSRDASDASSSSAAEDPIPIPSETGHANTRIAFEPLAHSSVTASLDRLRDRSHCPLSVPQGRNAALERLRLRPTSGT